MARKRRNASGDRSRSVFKQQRMRRLKKEAAIEMSGVMLDGSAVAYERGSAAALERVRLFLRAEWDLIELDDLEECVAILKEWE